jgi:hypothetical protein
MRILFLGRDELKKLTRAQSKDAVQLCALLVDETYGELASVGSHAAFHLCASIKQKNPAFLQSSAC